MEMLVMMYLLVLHDPTGREVTLNAKRVTAMRQGEGKGEYVTKEAGCIIFTEDGKFVTVAESCAEVRRQIQILEQKEQEEG